MSHLSAPCSSLQNQIDLTGATVDCVHVQTLAVTHLPSNISESEHSDKAMETKSLDIVENWETAPETRELSLFTWDATDLTSHEMTESLEILELTIGLHKHLAFPRSEQK